VEKELNVKVKIFVDIITLKNELEYNERKYLPWNNVTKRVLAITR